MPFSWHQHIQRYVYYQLQEEKRKKVEKSEEIIKNKNKKGIQTKERKKEWEEKIFQKNRKKRKEVLGRNKRPRNK